MRKEDFIFNHKDDEYKDYWFDVTGETKKELTHKYIEMCMVEVISVVYSKVDNVIGVKRLFPFNYDVVIPDDAELKSVLIDLVSEKEN